MQFHAILTTFYLLAPVVLSALQNQTIKQVASNVFINNNSNNSDQVINATRVDVLPATGRFELRINQQQQQQQAFKNSSHVQTRPRQVVSSLPDLAAATAAIANKTHKNLTNVRQHWRLMENSISHSLIAISEQLKQTLDELSPAQLGGASKAGSVSAACRHSLYELAEGLAVPKLWASQIFDSSAKLPSGMLEGTLTELGNLDQCLDVNYLLQSSATGERQSSQQETETATSERLVVGQYCSLLIKPHLTMRPRFHTVCQRLSPLSTTTTTATATINANQTTGMEWSPFKLLSQNSHHFHYAGLRLGICTPSKCSRSDVQLLLTSYLNKYELIGQVKSCQISSQFDDNKPRFDFVQQCIMSTFVALLLLSFLGTLIDLCAPKRINVLEVTANCGETIKVNMQASDPKRRVQGNKSCQYQVYRLGSDLIGSGSSHSLATQLNPISEAASLESGRSTASKASDERLSPKSITGAGQLDEEEWIAQLERNQNECQIEYPINAAGNNSATNSLLKNLLLCFSIRKSLQVIGKHAIVVSGKQDDMGDIQVIHGIRTIAMFWIIFGHTVGLVSPDMMNKLFSLAQLSCSSRFLQALLNATLAVNTFFMISGLVTVLSLVRKCKSCRVLINENKRNCANKRQRRLSSNHKFDSLSADDSSSVTSSLSSSASSNRCINKRHTAKNKASKSYRKVSSGVDGLTPDDKATSDFLNDFKPFLWLAMRYIRLTPSYAAIIGLAILMPALGSGPFWQETVGQMGPACRQSWWLNLLYLNNFIDTDRLCLIHSWYLSNDWQFFTLTLLLFGLFFKSKKLTLLLIICLAIASSAATFTITVTNNFPPTIVSTSPAVAERWLFIHSLYYKPWPHLGSYLIGMLTGYCILIKDKIHISSNWRATIWFALTLLALTLLNSIYPWNMGLQVEPLLTGLHSSTFRTLWAICCAWLVFALVTRPKNPLARLLSWHGFQVTSRLTFCTYLVHPLIIFYHFGTMNERIDSSIYGQFHRFMATLTLSYLAALILSILVEGPSIQMQQLLARLSSSSRKENAGTAASDMNMKAQRFKEKRLSDGSSAASNWSASSSFSEQVAADAAAIETTTPSTIIGPFTLIGGLGKHQQPKPINLSTQSFVDIPNQLKSCSKHCSEEQTVAISRKPARRSQPEEELTSTENSIALDADFQEKLAQAISRGFRIRSKLAEGTIKQVGNQQVPKRGELASRLDQRSRASSVCDLGLRSELSTFRQLQQQPIEPTARGVRPKP